MTHQPSWPGFVPAIHVFGHRENQDVDARDKRGLMQDPTSGDQRALRLLTALHESITSKGRSHRRRV
jgi:hypothetical protein